jgi:hypothetical protein
MREFKFVAVTLCLLDNDKRSEIFSKAAQNDNDLALDYPTFHARFKQSLEIAQSGVLGSHVKRNLVSLKAGKYAGIKLLGVGEDVAAAQDVTAMDPDHFQIEAIVAKQKAGSGHQYFLKWLGYPDSENTWEPAKRVEKTAPDLVAAYERGDSASTQQAAARAARVANRAAFQAPEESADEIAALGVEAREAVQKKLKTELGSTLPQWHRQCWRHSTSASPCLKSSSICEKCMTFGECHGTMTLI